MKDKVMQLRVTNEFTAMVEYLQKINGYKSASDTIRKTIEKEYRKEAIQGRCNDCKWYGNEMMCPCYRISPPSWEYCYCAERK